MSTGPGPGDFPFLTESVARFPASSRLGAQQTTTLAYVTLPACLERSAFMPAVSGCPNYSVARAAASADRVRSSIRCLTCVVFHVMLCYAAVAVCGPDTQCPLQCKRHAQSLRNAPRYMGTAAYGGDNEANWRELSSFDGQRFVILGGKVR